MRKKKKRAGGPNGQAVRRIWQGRILTAMCLLLALAFILPAAASQEDTGAKTVRVGWYESSFNYMDQFGRRFGYAYEYQQKIAAYTGWTYEYVEGSWSDLLHMLENGEIDLMSDVSLTQERRERMLFSSIPMGTEAYYAFISDANKEIRPDDLTTFNGKRVGMNEGSVQVGYFQEWAEQYGVQAEIVTRAFSEEEWMQMLYNGEIDAFVTVDSFRDDVHCVPVCKIGQSDFYFSVSKARPDLLAELNAAMSRIQDENRYYSEQLYDQYVRTLGANSFLAADEAEWLSRHGTIRVGYRVDYLPFCDMDLTTGAFKGALKDYFELAADSLNNVELTFEPVAFNSVESALKALRNGEIDCVFPANLSVFDGEEMDLITTSPLMKTESYTVVKNTELSDLSPQQQMTVAISVGDVNIEVFIKDYFPAWKTVYLEGLDACFRAVRSDLADCCFVSNYRLYIVHDILEQYNLAAVANGKIMNHCFAVRRGDDCLYSILNKTIGLIPAASIDSALASYAYPGENQTVSQFLHENSMSIIFVITTVFVVIVVLLLQSLKNARRANAGEQLISATELDPLTGLYNKSFFFEYVSRMRSEDPERAMDAIAIDVDQFRSVNALNGREFGDSVLRLLGGEIRAFLNENNGIATRFDGDRFDIYCEHIKDHQQLFDRFQNRLNELSRNVSVRLLMGVMPWQKDIEPGQQFEHAWSACNMTRKGYQNRLMVYDQKMREKELQEQRLLNDLHRAVEDHEFVVYYQPKYNVQVSTPKLCSAEALVRWQHPELGLIPPDQFVPLLEREGQINLVDHYVWREAARQIAHWRSQYGVTVPISVNLSRVDVFDPELENILEDLVEKNGLERKSLKLEVTESAYTNNAEQLVELVDRLRKKGYEIEMDDFGTNYSSLNMLSSMPVDVLKMDKAFIRNIGSDEKGVHLVQLILDIGKTLNVPVVAEGVETESQMLLLKELGCPLVQGYYFSEPMPPEDFGRSILGGAAS